MMFNCKARVAWFADDDHCNYYLVTIRGTNAWNQPDPDIAPPYLARVDCSNSLCKRVRVLNRNILDINHNEDYDEYYLELAKQEAIRALGWWGFEVEEVEDANC
jgi:hypothetical protein